MNNLDFRAGLQSANIQSAQTVSEWERFSTGLQNKLNTTELKFVKAEAGRIGFAHLFKMVVDELKRVDPTNPLVAKEAQLKIIGSKISERAADLGYIYDQNTDSIIGKRGK